MATVEDNTLDAETLALFANAPERFTKRLRREGECVVWTGVRQAWGYGRFLFEYKQWGTHRLSYTWFHGEIPDGAHVLHNCDNPSCVNPHHLRIGTNLENRLESVAKKRHVYGERVTQAKLTREQVAEIRARCESGESQTKLGKEYGVSQTAISKIVRNVRWSCVDTRPVVDRFKGAGRYNAKLTDDIVRDIRSRVASGEKQNDLAAKYGVHKQTLSSVVRRETWKHVL